MAQTLADLVARCQHEIIGVADVIGRVETVAARMRALLAEGAVGLAPQQTRPDPTGYARHAVHVAGEHELSLFAMVWLPGQWTPVHDHGTWGVVGIVQGVLEEQSYAVANDGERFHLQRCAVNLLPAGAVCGFVAQPDHIHRVGVPAGHATCISLHMYGNYLSSFHVYDVAAGTRQRVQVAHD